MENNGCGALILFLIILIALIYLLCITIDNVFAVREIYENLIYVKK